MKLNWLLEYLRGHEADWMMITMKSIWISKNGCNCIFTWAEILWSWLHNPKWRTLSLKSVLDHPNLGAPLPLWSFMGCCLSWFAAVFATDSQPLWSCFWAAVCADLLLLMLLFGLLFAAVLELKGCYLRAVMLLAAVVWSLVIAEYLLISCILPLLLLLGLVCSWLQVSNLLWNTLTWALFCWDRSFLVLLIYVVNCIFISWLLLWVCLLSSIVDVALGNKRVIKFFVQNLILHGVFFKGRCFKIRLRDLGLKPCFIKFGFQNPC